MELILFPTEQLTNASYPSLEIGGKWVWVPHEEKCILHLPRMPIQSSDDFSCMLPCYYHAPIAHPLPGIHQLLILPMPS
jgi:hypothetical protein